MYKIFYKPELKFDDYGEEEIVVKREVWLEIPRKLDAQSGLLIDDPVLFPCPVCGSRTTKHKSFCGLMF